MIHKYTTERKKEGKNIETYLSCITRFELRQELNDLLSFAGVVKKPLLTSWRHRLRVLPSLLPHVATLVHSGAKFPLKIIKRCVICWETLQNNTENFQQMTKSMLFRDELFRCVSRIYLDRIIQIPSAFVSKHSAVCCCKLNNTRYCRELWIPPFAVNSGQTIWQHGCQIHLILATEPPHLISII